MLPSYPVTGDLQSDRQHALQSLSPQQESAGGGSTRWSGTPPAESDRQQLPTQAVCAADHLRLCARQQDVPQDPLAAQGVRSVHRFAQGPLLELVCPRVDPLLDARRDRTRRGRSLGGFIHRCCHAHVRESQVYQLREYARASPQG